MTICWSNFLTRPVRPWTALQDSSASPRGARRPLRLVSFRLAPSIVSEYFSKLCILTKQLRNRAHLKICWSRVLPTDFWLEGLGFPLATLALPGISFVFEGLFGGRLKRVGKGPARQPSHFTMSSVSKENMRREDGAS